jgi:protease IV
LLLLGLVLSIGLNFLLLAAFPGCGGSSSRGGALEEQHHSGKVRSQNKIAVVKVEGVLLEGLTGYAQKQIEQAAADRDVKAVVLAINSPGGSITASDDLHRLLMRLRHGNPDKDRAPKPLVTSMASLAASGGYYIAMPAQAVFAERTTITGSIGVYAAFPNVAELADKYGFRMNVIKAGRVKDSGSFFHRMTPAERQIWQDMVDHAYRQFLAVVEEGRPNLKGKLEEEILPQTITVPETREPLRVSRQRADGGIFTADHALKLGLIDHVGYLEDAIKEVRSLAGLGDDYRVVTYDRPATLLGALLGVEARAVRPGLDAAGLAEGAVPRLWYLAPQSELAGILAASGAAKP